MRRLIDRRQKLLTKLPPLDEILRGSLVERAVRCGKAACRCADGVPHRVAYLSVTHRGGRTEQISIPGELLSQVRHGLAVYLQWWEILEKVSAINRDLLRHARAKRSGGRDGDRRRVVGGQRAQSR